MKPIIDLHLHLDGSLRISTMLDIAQREGIKLLTHDAQQLRHALRCGRVRHSLADYLTAFPITLSVLQSKYAVTRAVEELLEDCAAEGLKYVEIRFAPTLHTQGKMKAWDAVDAALRGLEKGPSLGIGANLILCSMRHFKPETTELIALLAKTYHGHGGGVAAIDMAGDDTLPTLPDHAHAFEWAYGWGLGVTIHAGEAGPASDIIFAVERCCARRIGHGIRALDDPKIMDRLRICETTIEVCLTSNLQTKTVASYASHPARELLKRGERVTLNTDNRLLANVTLDSEFQMAKLHWPELDDKGTRFLQLAALEASYAPLGLRAEMRRLIDWKY